MRWTVHGERVLYDSEWMRLALTDVELPSGKRFEHHVLRMPAHASGVVVDVADRGVLLLWRHRFTTDTWGWEIPAGRIDPGETVEHAGRRETEEESGWRPGPLTPLTTYFPHNGSSDATFHLLLATEATHVGDPPIPTRPSGWSGSPGSTWSRRCVRAGSATACRSPPSCGAWRCHRTR